MLTDSADVFARFVVALETVSEEDLYEPERFADMPAGWRPWRILYDPGHYAAHLQSIRIWLGARAPAMEP